MTRAKAPDPRFLEQFMQGKRLSRLEQVLQHRSRALTVVLDGVYHHHNIAAVIRSADAFGLQSVHLVGSGFSHSKNVSLGSEQWIEVIHHETPTAALEALKAQGYKIVVTAPEDSPKGAHVQSLAVHALPFTERLAVVFGNEKRGISDELFQAAEIHAFIPMLGFVESLNISVACAITLYASMTSGENRERELPLLSAEDRDAVWNDWLKSGMKRSDIILREVSRREEK